MNRKLNISYYTAKKMLMELLANDKLLEDEDIKEMLKDMALQKGKTDTCFKDTPIVIDTQCRLFFPIYSEKEVKMSYLPKTVYIFFLLHHTGVEFKNLDSYMKELYQIYQIVSEEKNIEAGKIKRSLSNLVAPGNNRIYNPQNEMFRLLGTKRSFSQNETFFFSHPYPALFRLISHF